MRISDCYIIKTPWAFSGNWPSFLECQRALGIIIIVLGILYLLICQEIENGHTFKWLENIISLLTVWATDPFFDYFQESTLSNLTWRCPCVFCIEHLLWIDCQMEGDIQASILLQEKVLFYRFDKQLYQSIYPQTTSLIFGNIFR